MIAYRDDSGNALYDAGRMVVTEAGMAATLANFGNVNFSSAFQQDVEPFIDHDITWRRR
jgi:hypothetical protein